MAQDLESRIAVVWKAAIWLQLEKVEAALDLLETMAGPDLDQWTTEVLQGAARLRDAQAHIIRASLLEREGNRDPAAAEWARAVQACRDAVAAMPLPAPAPPTDRRFISPDPWPHVVGWFQEYLEREHERFTREPSVGLA